MVTYEVINRNGEQVLQATGCTKPVRDLILPPAARFPSRTGIPDSGEADAGSGILSGRSLPVRSIAGHAFSGQKELRTVRLPESLKTMRSFAFYDCPSLTSLELFNTTDDYYDGVIRQCPSLRLITVHCTVPDDFVIVREMLRDVDVTLWFRLLTKEGEIRLVFPEYVSEAREDTMARAIHFSIEGAGMAYRECVGKRSLDLKGYDRLLERLTDYDFEVAADIALGRLSCPVGLTEQAQKGYQQFLKENDGRALAALIRQDEKENRIRDIRLMTEQKLIGRDALDSSLELASEQGRTQISSLLMEYRSREFRGAEKTVFTLDW